jgi:phosphoglycolate phosphatase-like HAD superfamily hydrolase
VDFVRATTETGGAKFVPPEERNATFDQLAKEKPELKNVEPFKTVLSGDLEAIAKLPLPELLKIVAATLTGMTTEQFQADVKKWLATAKDHRWKRLTPNSPYQPMQEVLKYLRANRYKTYIVTGGGQDFVRVYSKRCTAFRPSK